jgi:hypothetical protein
MLLNAYAILLGLGFYLNRHDRRMLALTFAIGVSVFIPVPRDTAFAFYTFCIAAEACVALIAWWLDTRATELVVGICIVLVLAHVMGYILNGHPSLSSYRVIVPLLESAQLLMCVCMSPSLHARLQNRQT